MDQGFGVKVAGEWAWEVGASSERSIFKRAVPCSKVLELVDVSKVLKCALDNREGERFPSSSFLP